jgi:hypothetical protein
MAEPAAPTRPAGTASMVLAGIGVLVVFVVAVVLGVLVLSAGGATTRTFVVEAGTGERLDRGEVVELMPTEVRLGVGDTLVIRNDDERDYTVGPYRVRAGEELEQTFQRPQTLVGECSLSGTGEVRIVVT